MGFSLNVQDTKKEHNFQHKLIRNYTFKCFLTFYLSVKIFPQFLNPTGLVVKKYIGLQKRISVQTRMHEQCPCSLQWFRICRVQPPLLGKLFGQTLQWAENTELAEQWQLSITSCCSKINYYQMQAPVLRAGCFNQPYFVIFSPLWGLLSESLGRGLLKDLISDHGACRAAPGFTWVC